MLERKYAIRLSPEQILVLAGETNDTKIQLIFQIFLDWLNDMRWMEMSLIALREQDSRLNSEKITLCLKALYAKLELHKEPLVIHDLEKIWDYIDTLPVNLFNFIVLPQVYKGKSLKNSSLLGAFHLAGRMSADIPFNKDFGNISGVNAEYVVSLLMSGFISGFLTRLQLQLEELSGAEVNGRFTTSITTFSLPTTWGVITFASQSALGRLPTRITRMFLEPLDLATREKFKVLAFLNLNPLIPASRFIMRLASKNPEARTIEYEIKPVGRGDEDRRTFINEITSRFYQ